MKKIFIIGLFSMILLISGCSKYNKSSIKKDLNNNINSLKGYHVLGDLDIYSGDNTYKYKSFL